MNRLALPAALLACALGGTLAACNRTADPLDAFRATCRDLQSKGQLKAGLAIDDCARDLKSAADADDPTRRADELAARIQALVQQGQGKPAQTPDELRQAILAVQLLGRAAAPPVIARFQASRDPELRLAYAKALVGMCFEDCAAKKWDCIIPALLEGITPDKPEEVRSASAQGLARCSGKEYGDDAAAWNSWYATVKSP
jgi:hypothetical protein